MMLIIGILVWFSIIIAFFYFLFAKSENKLKEGEKREKIYDDTKNSEIADKILEALFPPLRWIRNRKIYERTKVEMRKAQDDRFQKTIRELSKLKVDAYKQLDDLKSEKEEQERIQKKHEKLSKGYPPPPPPKPKTFQDADLYAQMSNAIRKIQSEHYNIDPSNKNASIKKKGKKKRKNKGSGNPFSFTEERKYMSDDDSFNSLFE